MESVRVRIAWVLVWLAALEASAAFAQGGASPVSRVVCQLEPSALWTGPESHAQRAGVALYQTAVTRFEEGGERSRIEVPGLGVRGPLWISHDALGAYALEGARVRGTSVSVRRGGLVCVQHEDAGEGRAQVLVRTELGAGIRFEATGGLLEDRDGQQRWTGTYLRSGLSADEPTLEDPHASIPVEHFATAADGRTVEVFTAPGGTRLLTVSAGTTVSVTRIRQEGGWSAIRIGDGPFVLGFTQATLVGLSERERARQAQVAALAAQLGSSPNARFENGPAGSGAAATPAVLRGGDASQVIRLVRTGATLRTVGGEVLRASAGVYVRLVSAASNGQTRVLAALSRSVALYADVSAVDLLDAP